MTLRILYGWMAKPRMRGYKHDGRLSHDTEFDRWMRHCNINRREAAIALDLPEQRIRDLQAGWRNGTLNGSCVPSVLTRYAMAAVAAGLRPVPQEPEMYDKVVRLCEAAYSAGLTPWPAGERFAKSPYAKTRKPPRVPKAPKPKTRSKYGKRILTPKAQAS